MQLMTATDDSPRMLRLASQFLLDAAIVMEAEIAAGGPLMPAAPGPTVDGVRVTGMLPELAAGFEGAPLTAAEAFGPKVPEGTTSEGAVALPVATSFPSSVPLIPPPPFVAAVDPTSTPIAPVAPAIPAPTMGTAAVSPASEVKLDKDGLPHDPRIHSVTPTIITTGVWRRRRNLDSPTLVAVEAELRARIAAAPVSLPAAPFIPPPPNKLAAPNAPAPVIPPPPTTAWPAVPADQTTIDPFRQLMRRIDGHTVEGGRLAPDIAKALHVEFGVTGWADYVGVAKGKIPALMLRLDAVLA